MAGLAVTSPTAIHPALSPASTGTSTTESSTPNSSAHSSSATSDNFTAGGAAPNSDTAASDSSDASSSTLGANKTSSSTAVVTSQYPPGFPQSFSDNHNNNTTSTSRITSFFPLDPPVNHFSDAVRDGVLPGPSPLGLSSPISVAGHPVPDPVPTSMRGHRKSALSIDNIPRQTIMKALASVARNNKPEALSLPGMLSAHSGAEARPSSSSSQRLADALNELASRNTPTTAFPALQSPCFYHQRFEDAVDIDKVLEEIKNDDWMSHSRLVQTATGVREVSKQLQRRPIRRAVRNVMIVTKARDNELVFLTRELTMWLLRTPRYGSDIGVNVYVDAKLRNSKRFGAASIVDDDPRFNAKLRYWSPDLCWSQPEKFDLVLTLGGDGTVLFTSWLFQRVVPPVLSFSLGSLGFLTSFEFEKYKHHLNRIMGDEGMRVNLRMRFTCTVYRHGASGNEMEEGEQFEVLNELVIDRGPSPYVSNLELYGDNELLTVVQADGCIFSTPTGSTAYSLSAGGSLVSPDLPAILLTPICPHTLSFRPMVLSDTMLLRVSIPRNSRATAYCAFDGKGRVELKQGDHVTITASQYPFPTVMSSPTEWFDSVSRTLQWNTRAATQKGFENKNGQSVAEEDEPEWDIDTDSACYASEEGSISASPLRRQMSLLGM